MSYRYSIFTKPFKNFTMDELGAKIRSLGFNAIEFPLRDGYQVEPKDAERRLPVLANTLKKYGIAISSVASGTDEHIFAALQSIGCSILRIMAPSDGEKKGRAYFAWQAEFIKYLEKLEPLARKYNVTLGVQNHFGGMCSATMELKCAVDKFDPKYVAAIWDCAHAGLAGENMEQALDIIWDHMCLVNFKNAYNTRINGPEAPVAKFKPYFTLGRHGAADYTEIARYLKAREYKGDICLPAEYTDEPLVEALAPIELAFVKSLMED